jgi:hypothetical protein
VKRGKKVAIATEAATDDGGQAAHDESRLVKTTVFLPEPMSANLTFMALTTGKSKADIVRTALASHMNNQGYQPYNTPRLPERPTY